MRASSLREEEVFESMIFWRMSMVVVAEERVSTSGDLVRSMRSVRICYSESVPTLALRSVILSVI